MFLMSTSPRPKREELPSKQPYKKKQLGETFNPNNLRQGNKSSLEDQQKEETTKDEENDNDEKAEYDQACEQCGI